MIRWPYVIGILACTIAVPCVLHVERSAFVGRADAELQLMVDIGEIKRLDEVLTTSARLYALTGDRHYRDRYFEHVERLDALLARAQILSQAEGIDPELVGATEQANTRLVELETRAFELTDRGQGADGFALVSSQDYDSLKQRYWRGVDTAGERIAELAAADMTRRARVAHLLLIGVFATGILIVGFALHEMRRARRAERKAAELAAFQVTVDTMMDVTNNALSELQLYKLECNECEPDDFTRIDACVDRISEHLQQLGDVGEFRTEDKGGRQVVAITDAARETIAS